jgi:hypothetical protein
LKVLYWTLSVNLVYYISSPPIPIILSNIKVSDYDTLIPATYTFEINSFGSQTYLISAGKSLAIVIDIPLFYNDTFYAD